MKDWTQLLPLIGVAVGSGMTLLGQSLTDARALRRDRLMAEREAALKRRADWVALERQTITELQESIEMVYMITSELGTVRIPSQLQATASDIAVKIQSRVARLSDRELADDIITWMARTDRRSPEHLRQLRGLLERLGANLRQLHVDP